MNLEEERRGKSKGCKRPPLVGLMALLAGMLIGLSIPLSRFLRKKTGPQSSSEPAGGAES